MAGQRKTREAAAALRERVEELCGLLADGKSDRAAAHALGFTSPAPIYKLCDEDSAVAAAVARARRQGAAAMASDALDIADELQEHPTADPVRVANLRINQRQWLAARYNREQFGDSAKVAVQINVADMHLTALRAGTELALPVIEGEACELPPSEEDAEPTSLNDLL